MNIAQKYCLTAAGIFFLTGLVTGIWKYYKISQSKEAQAPFYIDTAHRASLLYSFASILLLIFAQYSVFSDTMNAWAAISALSFFGFAIVTYILHGILEDTDNQFRKPFQLGNFHLPEFLFHGFMFLLVIAELGGSAVLVVGTIKAIW
ncbi:MAG: hypothetical protein KBF93_21840 [Leptospiraceae bacterium]|nr:hypothetical protein [Leptospiraceae bacterium]